MKKIFSLVLILAVTLVSCEKEKLTQFKAKTKTSNETRLSYEMEGCAGSTRDLIAGQHTVVGSVSVDIDGDDYVITYTITDDEFCLTEAHIDVADDPSNFPQSKSGNPKIGNFDYVNEGTGCVDSFEVRVPNTGPWLAVHGVVVCSSNSVESVLAALPETVDFCGSGQFGPDSYINIEIDGEGMLSGPYGSYCVDNDAFINEGGCYTDMNVIVSTEGLPAGVENEDNVDAANWLLNQTWIGELSSNGVDAYTYGDVQYAIWLLLDPIEDDQPGLYTLGDYTVERAQEIADAALSAGEGFMPGCGDYIGLILQKEGIQPLMIPYLLECSPCDETVWAEGCGFPGSSWAMYFMYE